MVFQKKANKGGKPNQKAQTPNKKPKVEELDTMFDNDLDDEEMDSDDSAEMQKLPTKSPKGKQSLSEKRVSFQVPGGKNTPAKTPAKNSMSKKQGTPAKAGLQQFSGMKQNQKKPINKKDDDDEEDDDDDDDSDFEGDDLDLDLDDEDDDEDEENDDDDDDDDDEEDDDDDDDDDEDDDEEQETQNKSKKNAKAQKQDNGQKMQTPLKGQKGAQTPKSGQTPKNIQTPKAAQTPKSVQSPAKSPKNTNQEKVVSPMKNNVAFTEELERRRIRDLKQLYVGNLPHDVTQEELKALSSDIQGCILPRNDRGRNMFAFLLFASEEKAEENVEVLRNKKLRGQSLAIDYVGAKSKNQKTEQFTMEKQYNLKKLYMSGLPLDCTIYQIAKYFPKSYDVAFNQSQHFRSATVSFNTEEDCAEAYKANLNIEVSGVSVPVLHSTVGKPKPPRKNQRQRRDFAKRKFGNAFNGGNAAKKMKFVKKESSDDE